VPQYRANGVEVFCIVGQKRLSVAKFVADKDYDIPMLIDEDRNVIRAFDVYHAFGIDAFRIARPSVFFINPRGEIAFAYVGKNQTDRLPQTEIEKTVLALLDEAGDED